MSEKQIIEGCQCPYCETMRGLIRENRRELSRAPSDLALFAPEYMTESRAAVVSRLLTVSSTLSNAGVGAATSVMEELARAQALHPTPMRSAHEGFGVIYEEVHELLDEVRANDPDKQLKEATQIGAMAMRYLVDLGPTAGVAAPMGAMAGRGEKS